VVVNGQTRCGPCKNFLLRGMQRPAQISVTALMATIVTLLGGPGLILLLFMAAGVAAMRPDMQGARQAAAAIGCFGFLMQLTALVLAIAALRRIETNPRVGGRGLALTGLVGVLVFGVMIGEVAWLIWHSL
jgi:hypothetical protein